MRIINKWHDKQNRSLEQIAASLGFNAWKISYNAIKSIQDAKIYFSSRYQGLLVIAEFMAFQIQLADRLLYQRLDDQERELFIQSFASKCLQTLNDNRADFINEGLESNHDFRAIFNQRLNDYAMFSFDNPNKPGYASLRYLGEKIAQIMGKEDQDSKWVIDQVMEIEGFEVFKQLKNSLETLSS